MSGIYSLYHIKYPHKQYIGSTQQTFINRFNDHKKELKRGKHRKYLQHICDKYGIEGLRIAILFEFSAPKRILRHMEQKFIDHHISIYGRDNLLNGTTSSTSMLDDPDVIEKTKAINSIRMSQNNKNEEYLEKVKLGIKHKRENNKLYTEKRSEWAKNGLNSLENRQKCEAAIRKTCAKQVLCIELNKEFAAINDAVRYLKLNGYPKASKAYISKCARGINKVAYGYTWKFK